MSQVYPYDCDDMKYNKELRQYVLTIDGVQNNVFLDENIETELKNSNRIKRLLVEVSDDIYNFIYSFTHVRDVEKLRYLLAKRPHWRTVIKRAMLYQIRYALRSGGSFVKDQHGVDFERMRVIDSGVLRGNTHVSPEAERILKQNGILYSGNWHLNRRDIEDGTY